MNWRRGGEFFLLSDPPGFCVGRAGGDRWTYRAVRLDKPVPALLVIRDVDPADESARRDAIERCKAACVADNLEE